MTGYKLRVPEEGAILHGDGVAVAAATREAAREYLEDYEGEPVPYLHSYIGSCRVVYQRDIDGGDCHEDAERGDTTVDYMDDDGRELRSHEIRVWEIGAPRLARWSMKPILNEPVKPDQIPLRTSIWHSRLHNGCTAGAAFTIGRWWYVPVEFWDGKRLNCKIACLIVHRWGPVKYRLTINGEHIADGSEHRLRDLVDIREARLRAEWEAKQDRERQAEIACP